MAKYYSSTDDTLETILGLSQVANTFLDNTRQQQQFEMLKAQNELEEKRKRNTTAMFTDLETWSKEDPNIVANSTNPETATGTYEALLGRLAKKYTDSPLEDAYRVVGDFQKVITSNLAMDKMMSTAKLANVGLSKVAGYLSPTNRNVSAALDELEMITNNTQPLGTTKINRIPNEDGSYNFTTYSKSEKDEQGNPRILNEMSGRGTPEELLKKALDFWSPLASGNKEFVGTFLEEYDKVNKENQAAAQTWKHKSGNTAWGGNLKDPVNRNPAFRLNDNGNILNFASESDAIDAGWMPYSTKIQEKQASADIDIRSAAAQNANMTAEMAKRERQRFSIMRDEEAKYLKSIGVTDEDIVRKRRAAEGIETKEDKLAKYTKNFDEAVALGLSEVEAKEYALYSTDPKYAAFKEKQEARIEANKSRFAAAMEKSDVAPELQSLGLKAVSNGTPIDQVTVAIKAAQARVNTLQSDPAKQGLSEKAKEAEKQFILKDEFSKFIEQEDLEDKKFLALLKGGKEREISPTKRKKKLAKDADEVKIPGWTYPLGDYLRDTAPSTPKKAPVLFGEEDVSRRYMLGK